MLQRSELVVAGNSSRALRPLEQRGFVMRAEVLWLIDLPPLVSLKHPGVHADHAALLERGADRDEEHICHRDRLGPAAVAVVSRLQSI